MTRVVDELVEDALRELSDEATQTRLWQASEGPEVSSLVECTSRLWDDSGLATELDRAVVYSESIDERIRELRAVLHRKATLATRNVRHFEDLGVRLADPWVPTGRRTR